MSKAIIQELLQRIRRLTINSEFTDYDINKSFKKVCAFAHTFFATPAILVNKSASDLFQVMHIDLIHF